jgi:hypothetical protein
MKLMVVTIVLNASTSNTVFSRSPSLICVRLLTQPSATQSAVAAAAGGGGCGCAATP